MNKELILQMHSPFDALVQTHPEASDLEFWFARDLQEPLGYARWENFVTAIQRAIESCKTTGYEVGHHFRGVTKLIFSVGSWPWEFQFPLPTMANQDGVQTPRSIKRRGAAHSLLLPFLRGLGPLCVECHYATRSRRIR
jgi:hypothetical protein